MGKLGTDVYRRKLERMLGRGDDVAVLRLVWAVYALQSGEGPRVRQHIVHPPSAERARLGDPEYVYPWNLETIVNEALATPKAVRRPDRRELHLRGDTFDTMRELTNAVRALENAEEGTSLEQTDVFVELHRGIQRQFEWQRGFANRARVYRSALLYGSGAAARYFEEQVGLSPSDFMLTGFALYLGSQMSPLRTRDADMSSVGITPAMRETALARIATGIAEARIRAARLRRLRRPTAYSGSVLRDHPIIAVESGGALLTPLPPLLLNRITAGLYLDVVGGGEAVWRGIGARFEAYCIAYMRRMMEGHDVEGEIEYGPKRNRFRTPDVLVGRGGELHLVIECKAKRMTFDARFSDDPVATARRGYEEIAKGIFQVWRFLSHARRGVFADRAVAPDCLGMVVTTDPWLSMATNLEEEVLSIATKMAEADPEIIEQDRRRVAVTMIDDIELTLQTGDAGSFLRAIREGTQGDKLGWLLSTIHRDMGSAERPYPFDDEIGELLPWWRTRNC